ncbi:YutD-like domain-containing protein [Brevibacillus sp. GCM10020057]|uniref:YutD family protein n=1 Tax=Brevibacillus sp. GCM10020057 TaxID=3317327 RepID=UPI00362F24DA
MIRTQAGTYEVMEENRDGWNPEAFKERYSDILDKYDYIVGDWGYGQLRLRGFYTDHNRKVPFEQRIAALDEYLHEFCNFGCPYFVLRKVKSFQGPDDSQKGQDETNYDLVIDVRQEPGRDENSQFYGERKERRRYNSRPNNKERSNGSSPERSGGGRNERSDKPRFSKEKADKNGREREHNKDRRPNRQNRERDKVPTGPNTPKRDS